MFIDLKELFANTRSHSIFQVFSMCIGQPDDAGIADNFQKLRDLRLQHNMRLSEILEKCFYDYSLPYHTHAYIHNIDTCACVTYTQILLPWLLKI